MTSRWTRRGSAGSRAARCPCSGRSTSPGAASCPRAFERKLFVIRKLVENHIRAEGLDPERRFHVPSLSSETIVYKGLMLPEQLASFYQDLQDEDVQSGLALVHSRFSTNTFPTWELAQPFRFIGHNGEINTLRGNRNHLNARRSQLSVGQVRREPRPAVPHRAARAVATRRSSTTCSSCWSSAAAACRTR